MSLAAQRARPPSGITALAPIGRIGRYDVLGRLGRGGMAEVFVARASGPRDVSRLLVVKRLLPDVGSDPRKVEAFVTEAKLTSRLSHPNLGAVVDFGDDRGSFFLAMEWVRGRSLRDVIERARERGGVPVPVAARMIASLAAALHHAHSARDDAGRPLGIVHRDVTPENVIVGWNGVPKLIDFGIAKSVVDPQKTEAGVVKGKLAYIAPEQFRGLPLDGRSDVFALALCGYELLTGTSAYGGMTEMATVAAIVIDPEVPSARAIRPDVPEALDAILRRGLAKDRDARWTSADAMARALEDWLAARGAPVGEREVAALMASIFDDAGADPELDRAPLEGAARRRRTASEEMHVLALGAEAELDAERIEAGHHRRRRATVAIMLALLLAALAVIAWAVARPRGEVAPPEPAADRSSPRG